MWRDSFSLPTIALVNPEDPSSSRRTSQDTGGDSLFRLERRASQLRRNPGGFYEFREASQNPLFRIRTEEEEESVFETANREARHQDDAYGEQDAGGEQAKDTEISSALPPPQHVFGERSLSSIQSMRLSRPATSTDSSNRGWLKRQSRGRSLSTMMRFSRKSRVHKETNG